MKLDERETQPSEEDGRIIFQESTPQRTSQPHRIILARQMRVGAGLAWFNRSGLDSMVWLDFQIHLRGVTRL